MIKHISFVFIVLLSSMIHAAPVEHLDKIVAVVNDGVVTESELNQQVGILRAQMSGKDMKMPPEQVLRKQVLQHLINVNLQMQVAKQHDVAVDSVDLNNAVRNIAKRNKMNVTELRHTISQQGMSWQTYRDNLKKEMIIARLQQKAIGPSIQITANQVENYLKSAKNDVTSQQKYHVKNIVIPLSDAPTSEQLQNGEQKALDIVNKIKKGEDFSQLAISESSGEFALEGGDLGLRHLAELPEVFAKQVAKMSVGQVSKPIRTANGFHIIKLVAIDGKKQKHLVNLTKVRHILVKPDASMTEREALKQLSNIHQQLKNGKPFAEMAKKHSRDPVSAIKGGDLGWIHPGELVPEFEKAMAKLKKNQISKPVKSQFGWHIIQVLDRKKVDDSKNYEKLQVKQALYQRKFTEAVQNWQQQLRGHAFIKIVDKTLA
jgi:peptidyl-prolyl cis-trans isomerase SurA